MPPISAEIHIDRRQDMPTDTNTMLGLGFVLLATLCNGTFALPPKFVRNWAWENTWGAFFFLTLLVLPAAVVAMRRS